VTTWLLEPARTRSIETHSAGIQVPPGLDDPEKVLIGVDHYAPQCAVCHGAPGVPKGDIARGLYPPPPDMAKAAPFYSPAGLFWIVKHGIKVTGMPAWSDHSDDELWTTVACLEKLPGMSEQEYATLVTASLAMVATTITPLVTTTPSILIPPSHLSRGHLMRSATYLAKSNARERSRRSSIPVRFRPTCRV
jgi:mono/diheme cytochrome c family protein